MIEKRWRWLIKNKAAWKVRKWLLSLSGTTTCNGFKTRKLSFSDLRRLGNSLQHVNCLSHRVTFTSIKWKRLKKQWWIIITWWMRLLSRVKLWQPLSAPRNVPGRPHSNQSPSSLLPRLRPTVTKSHAKKHQMAKKLLRHVSSKAKVSRLIRYPKLQKPPTKPQARRNNNQ